MSSIPWCKKSKMTKNSNQRGSCLNRRTLLPISKRAFVEMTSSNRSSPWNPNVPCFKTSTSLNPNVSNNTMISGSRRKLNHPSHPPRNLTRTSSEIRPRQTLNPSASPLILTSFEKQSSVRHKTPPHKLCSLNICHVNICSLLAESRLIELESLCAAPLNRRFVSFGDMVVTLTC